RARPRPRPARQPDRQHPGRAAPRRDRRAQPPRRRAAGPATADRPRPRSQRGGRRLRARRLARPGRRRRRVRDRRGRTAAERPRPRRPGGPSRTRRTAARPRRPRSRLPDRTRSPQLRRRTIMGYSLPLRTRAVALASAGALAAAGALAGLTATPAHAQQVPEYEYFVAPTGDDDGPGTADRPLGSLEEAQQRARQAAAAGDGDVAGNLMDGVFRPDSPLRFEAADAGRHRHPVLRRAA